MHGYEILFTKNEQNKDMYKKVLTGREWIRMFACDWSIETFFTDWSIFLSIWISSL